MLKFYSLILAAGFSTRMVGDFKPLLPLPGNTLNLKEQVSALELVILTNQRANIQPLVVCGHRFHETSEIALAKGANFVVNPKPEYGMFSSILCGLEKLPSECTHFLVQPVDIPLIQMTTLKALCEKLEKMQTAIQKETKQKATNQEVIGQVAKDGINKAKDLLDWTILMPQYQGQAGHPPVIPFSLRDKLLNYNGHGGLAGFLANYPVSYLEVADQFILLDMDTKEDYNNLCQLAKKLNIDNN